jgi:hypothetical protein
MATAPPSQIKQELSYIYCTINPISTDTVKLIPARLEREACGMGVKLPACGPQQHLPPIKYPRTKLAEVMPSAAIGSLLRQNDSPQAHRVWGRKRVEDSHRLYVMQTSAF